MCGSSETVDSIGPPSAKSTSVSHSGHEGGGRGEGGGRIEVKKCKYIKAIVLVD